MTVATPAQRIARPVPFWPWGYVATGAVALAAALAAPLAAYVFLIALFGLPHVLSELRYIDERFSARAPKRALTAIAAILSVLVGVRIAESFGLVAGAVAVPLELSLGIALTAAAVWFMPRRFALGALAGVAITCGTIFAPITTFLIFAWLHNLTPLAFISEILPRRDRARALAMLSIPFIALPALVASGVLQGLVRKLFGYAVANGPSLFGAGHAPTAAFLAGGLPFPDAVTLFSAALVAQAMHYFSVIVVMPRLLRRAGKADGPSLVPWPSWKRFYFAIALFGVAMLGFNAVNYQAARTLYSLFAAIHSWLELPVFLIALGYGFSATPAGESRPATI